MMLNSLKNNINPFDFNIPCIAERNCNLYDVLEILSQILSLLIDFCPHGQRISKISKIRSELQLQYPLRSCFMRKILVERSITLFSPNK